MGNLPTRPIRRRSLATALVAAFVAISPSIASADMDGPRPITRENPAYPFSALSRGVEGSVLVEYTVDARGRVVAPRVLEANPPGVFDAAALRALSRWRYEAQTEPTTMKVKLTFRR